MSSAAPMSTATTESGALTAADSAAKVATKRILLVVDHFYPYIGGNETLYWNVTRALVRDGHSVTVVTRQEPNTAPREMLEGIDVRRVWTPEWMQRLFFMLLSLPALWRAAREVDVVHAVVYASALPAWCIALIRRKPFVLTVHEAFGPHWYTLVDVNWFGATLLRMFEWLLLHLPWTHYNCGAHFTARRLQEIGRIRPNRISVIPYVVDYDFWNPACHTARDLRTQLQLPADTFLYLYFGRPGASKGVEYLVQAAAQVRPALPTGRLVLLLGKHPANRYARIRQLIDELQLQDHLILLDPVPHADLPSYLLAANCIIVPSISEGFGYSAIEAATLGCHVISTTGHAVEEVLAGDVDLVPPRDALALANQILVVSRERPSTKPTAKRYDVATHTLGLIAMYSKMCKTR